MGQIEYQVDGKSCYRTTDILSDALNESRGLLIWANRLGHQNIDYFSELQTAQSIGTEFHDAAEAYVKDSEILNDFQHAETSNCFSKFKKWWDADMTEYEIVNTELSLVSPTYLFGGTLDLLLKKDNKFILVDYKTSSSIKLDNILQAGAYSHLLQISENIIVDKFLLARFGKKEDDKDFEIRAYDKSDLDKCFDHFLLMLETLNSKNKVKKLLKQKGSKVK